MDVGQDDIIDVVNARIRSVSQELTVEVNPLKERYLFIKMRMLKSALRKLKRGISYIEDVDKTKILSLVSLVIFSFWGFYIG